MLSILAPFTTVEATALWAVHSVAASHTRGDGPQGHGTAVSGANDLPVRSAKGSLTYQGATAKLKFAGARLSIKKDERKPIVLLISDQKLRVEKWESEFDMMMDCSGVVFFLDKDLPGYGSVTSGVR